MTRNVARRAGALFLVLAALALVVCVGSQARLAEVLFLVAGALTAVLALFSATPVPQAVPVRVRRQRRR